MTVYRQVYDNATKANMLPVGTEAQKAMVLKIDDKSEDKRLYIGGLAYFAVTDGQHWVIGCDESVFFVHTSLFFKKKNESTGKWEDQPNEEKAVKTAYESNGCCYALCVDSHAGAEALVKALDGKYLDTDFYIESQDGDKVTSVVNGILADESVDIAGVLSNTFIELTADEFTSQLDRRKNVVPHPLLEGGKPVVLAHLPKVKAGKSAWGGGRSGFLATADRVKEVLAFKASADFDALYLWYTQDPAKVAFALALTGVAIQLPLIVSQASTVDVDAVDVLDGTTDIQAVLDNFKAVMAKEGNGDVDNYSPDAVKAVAHPDIVDAYKMALFKLADFTVNGKSFPFGITKQKLGVTGSVFVLTLEKLLELQSKALSD